MAAILRKKKNPATAKGAGFFELVRYQRMDYFVR
jgi:hypothetical protein